MENEKAPDYADLGYRDECPLKDDRRRIRRERKERYDKKDVDRRQ